MPIQTLRRLTPAENNNESLKDRMREFMKFIVQKYGDSISPPPKSEEINIPFVEDDLYQPYEGLYGEESETLPDADDIVDLDLYMDAEVMLPKDGEYMQAARVIGPARDKNGKQIGTFNQNPILNTKVYEVMFPDGSVSKYAANIIAENIYSQVDKDGHRYQMIDCILDHRKTAAAIPMSEGYIVSSNGN